MFAHDSDANLQFSAIDDEEMEDSCDEDSVENDESDEDTRIVAQALTPVPPAPENYQLTIDRHSGIEDREFTIAPVTNKLWKKPWSPPKALDTIPLFLNIERSSAIFNSVGHHYHNLHGADCPGFQVEGQCEEELIWKFKDIIRSAISCKSWDVVLSPNRHFTLNQIDTDGDEEFVTSGPGVEQSVMNGLFHEYFVTRASEFCTPLLDDFSTLTTLPQTGSTHMSQAKKEELAMFGAVTALALIYGCYPGKLNPLLLIYLLNKNELRCLHRQLVFQHFPALGNTLDDWLSIGPEDNVQRFTSHFASFHNIQVAALHGRSPAGHQRLASDMLHNAIIGPVGVDNIFFQAFLEGFEMPCIDSSLKLNDIVRSFYGGAEEFVQSAETSIIRRFEDLNFIIHVNLGAATLRDFADTCSEAGTSFEGKIFDDIFRDFLEETGAPCPQLLESIKDRLSVMPWLQPDQSQ
ncbi:hypothetical protein GG344DRAFT_84457 [Lentinula edodes]|nr:hypothetical protein GG344DRAFT_84457 [Lentinula edodes]